MENPEHEEREVTTPITYENIFEEIGHLEYRIRKLFNKEFHTAAPENETEVEQDLKSTEKELEKVETLSADEVTKLKSDLNKAYTLFYAFQFLQSKQPEEGLEEKVLFRGESAGWSKLKDETWRPQFIAKVGKCDLLTAVKLSAKYEDLRIAISESKKGIKFGDTPSFGGAPPNAQAIATLRRVAKSKH
eukprot:augustus_masked-scaffold_58-processed-gene-0.5-mRNA-1 protein AED:1.00 eAED:1.00 QI:0/-1/0/0/-1/1/1/0/188